MEKDKSKSSPEIEKINAVLDKTVRPFLSADGGGLEIVDFKNNVFRSGSCSNNWYLCISNRNVTNLHKYF